MYICCQNKEKVSVGCVKDWNHTYLRSSMMHLISPESYHP